MIVLLKRISVLGASVLPVVGYTRISSHLPLPKWLTAGCSCRSLSCHRLLIWFPTKPKMTDRQLAQTPTCPKWPPKDDEHRNPKVPERQYFNFLILRIRGKTLDNRLERMDHKNTAVSFVFVLFTEVWPQK